MDNTKWKKVQSDPIDAYFPEWKPDRIALDFFPFCIIRTAGAKRLKLFQLFIRNISGLEDDRFKLKQKIGTEGTVGAGSWGNILSYMLSYGAIFW